MSFGVTIDGFKRKRLQDIKAEFEGDYRAIFGDIRTDPESGFGQIIGVQSDQISLIWEAMEDVYFSQYPATADGSSLDNVLNLNGLSRLNSLPSLIDLVLSRVDETQEVTVSSAPEFQVLSNDEDLFKLTEDVILYDLRDAQSPGIEFEITGVYIEVAGEPTTYTLTLNGVEISHQSQPGDTLDEILTGINDEIVSAEITGVASELVPRVPIPVGVNTGTVTLYIRATGTSFTFGQYSGQATLTLYQSARFASLENAVENVIYAEPFGVVQTPRAGIQSDVSSFSDGIIGRGIETDADARLRRFESLQVIGGATVDAIRARLLQQVEGVFAATVLENDTLLPIPVNLPIPFDEFPPKSIWCIVDGGTDEDVAEKIFEVKSAGIQPFGDQGPFVVIDDQNIEHNIMFSRSTNVSIYVIIEITLNPEETAPSNVTQVVRDNVVDYINSLGISDDVIFQKLFTPVYAAGGISQVDMEIGTSPSPSSQSNIPIDFNEKARTDDVKVLVSIA
jgi:hypothetical protein